MTKQHGYTLVFSLFFGFVLPNLSFAEPSNLGLLKLELVEYHDSGKYLSEVTAIASLASAYLDKAVALNRHLTKPKRLALVLDIDETSLSNYNDMQQHDFSYNADQATRDLLAAHDPAILPVLHLYQHAIQHGIAVFFITGRDQSLSEGTIKNLRAAGYKQWSGISFRPDKTSTIPFKTSERLKIEQKGYTILASIGDQYSDLLGGHALRVFKLPNPFYYLP